MKTRSMILYGTIFLICFFLVGTFFFSVHNIEYAHEIQTNSAKTTDEIQSIPLSDRLTYSETPELSSFYQLVEQGLIAASNTFNGDIGITYVDLSTGKQISVNGTTEFYSASTIKVPLAMMIADSVQDGKLSWDDELTYNEKNDYEEGTGIIVNNIQPTYSLRTLQKYVIVYSDNIAKNMLYDTFGDSVSAKQALYAHFLQKETDWNDAKFTSEDAANILTILYDEKSTNQDYQTIYDYMKQTVFHERMDTATTSGKAAHKIGSYGGNLHDIGIFESDHPFILTVFTNGPTTDGLSLISTITDQVWTIQQEHYPDVELSN